MRIIFGILSFCTAGLLAYYISPSVQQVLIPCWLQGKSSGGLIQLQYGPFLLDERGICIFVALLALLPIALVFTGIYALTPRDRTDAVKPLLEDRQNPL